MFDFVLALARLLADIPYIAVPNDENEDSPCLDMKWVEQRYDGMSDIDKRRLADFWQTFLAIVDRQNDVHRDAAQLNVELVRCIGRELLDRSARSPDSGSDLPGAGNLGDDEDWDGVEVLQAELWRLSCKMPRVVLAEVVEFARGQVEVA